MVRMLIACSVFLGLTVFTACQALRIPVEVHPAYSDAGTPLPLPVAPEPMTVTAQGDGSTTSYRIELADDATPVPPAPPGINWEAVFQVVLGVAGVAGGGYGLMAARIAGKARTALRIVADLADANADAADDVQVTRNKDIAKEQQEAAGVRHLVQEVRGKTV